MNIQINTDDHIQGREDVADSVRVLVETALLRYRDQITRVEVHLGDENADKSGQRDKRCLVEARLEGRQPVTATALAATVSQAVQEASDKLSRLIESQLGRLASARRTPPPAEV
jgi:hypothetical protein